MTDPDPIHVETFVAVARQRLGCGHYVEAGAELITVRRGPSVIEFSGCPRCFREHYPDRPGL